MEYFAGSLITLITIFVVSKINKKQVKKFKPISVNFSQSRLHQLMLPVEVIQQFLESKKAKPSQSLDHFNKMSFKVLFIDNYAYWIKNNAFMVAEVEDGKILQETAKPVDTIGMSKIELDKMIFIVDKLKEGVTDDRGNSGK